MFHFMAMLHWALLIINAVGLGEPLLRLILIISLLDWFAVSLILFYDFTG